MITDIATNNDGSFVWENFDIKATSSVSEWVAQKLRTKLKFFLGEYFLNITLGLPWFQTIFEKTNNPEIGWSLIKQEILNTEYVVELLEFTPDVNNSLRYVTITFKVRITTGETVTITETIGAV